MGSFKTSWRPIEGQVASLGSGSAAGAFGLGRKIEAFMTRLRGSAAFSMLPSSVRGLGDLRASIGETPSVFGNGDGRPSAPPAPSRPEVSAPAASAAPIDPKLDRAYRASKLVLNAMTAGVAGAMLGLTAVSAYGVLLHSGWAGFQGTAWWVGMAFAFPMIGEVARRFRPASGEGLPHLDATKHPELYRMVADLARRAGLAMPELLFWDMKAPNAAATGIESPIVVTKTYVIFTAGILRILKPEELTGVIGHELSHIRHHDILILGFRGLLGMAFMMNVFGMAAPWPIMLSMLVGMELLSQLIVRLRESLADQGGAWLTGRPGSLASGLMRLDLWVRMVAGRNTAPVGAFSLEDVTTDHPPVLRRAEAMRRLEEAAPAGRRTLLGTRQAWMGSIEGALSLLGGPLMMVLFVKLSFFKAFVLYSALSRAIGAVRSELARRANAVDMVADRLGAYLQHPDPAVRGWAAAGLRKIAPQALNARLIDGAAAAVGAAVGAERDAEIAARLKRARWMLTLRRARLLRRSRKDGSEQEERFEKAIQVARDEDRVSDDLVSPALVLAMLARAVRDDRAASAAGSTFRARFARVVRTFLARWGFWTGEPEALASLAGPSTLETLRGLKMKIVRPGQDDPPFLSPDLRGTEDEDAGGKEVFFRLSGDGTLYVASPFWNLLSRQARAGLLYRAAAELRARRAFAARGRAWIAADPGVEDMLAVIGRATPLAGGGALSVKLAQEEALEAHRDAERAKTRLSFWSRTLGGALEIAGRLIGALGLVVQIAGLELSTAGFLAALAWGAALGALGLAWGAGLAAAFLTGAAAAFAYARLRMLPWGASGVIHSLAWFAAPAALALLGLAAGHPLAAESAILAVLGSRMLRRGMELGTPDRGAVAAAGLLTMEVAAGALAGDPYAFYKTLVMAGYFFHLERHGVGGKPLALGGVFLALLSWGLFLAGQSYLSMGATLAAAHLLGGRMTRGLEPIKDKQEKLGDLKRLMGKVHKSLMTEKIYTLGVVGRVVDGKVVVALKPDMDTPELRARIIRGLGDLAASVELIRAERWDSVHGPLAGLTQAESALVADYLGVDAARRKAALDGLAAAGVTRLAAGDELLPLRDGERGDIATKAWRLARALDGARQELCVSLAYPAGEALAPGERVLVIADKAVPAAK